MGFSEKDMLRFFKALIIFGVCMGILISVLSIYALPIVWAFIKGCFG